MKQHLLSLLVKQEPATQSPGGIAGDRRRCCKQCCSLMMSRNQCRSKVHYFRLLVVGTVAVGAQLNTFDLPWETSAADCL